MGGLTDTQIVIGIIMAIVLVVMNLPALLEKLKDLQPPTPPAPIGDTPLPSPAEPDPTSPVKSGISGAVLFIEQLKAAGVMNEENAGTITIRDGFDALRSQYIPFPIEVAEKTHPKNRTTKTVTKE